MVCDPVVTPSVSGMWSVMDDANYQSWRNHLHYSSVFDSEVFLRLFGILPRR